MRNFTTYITLIATTLLTACTTELGSKAEKEPVKVTVSVIAEAGSGESVQNYSGVLTENRSALLSFQTGGKLIKLYVKEGEKVRKGQKLATVDQTQPLNALKSAEAALAQAKDGYARLNANSPQEPGGLHTLLSVQRSGKFHNYGRRKPSSSISRSYAHYKHRHHACEA